MSYHKDLAAGLLFLALGLGFAGTALLRLRMGQLLSMGPGYFPFVLGLVLAGLGLAIAAQGLRRRPEPLPTLPWRGLVCVLGALLVFAGTVRGLGLGPALAAASLLAARAAPGLGWPASLAIAAALTGFSLAVFVAGLGLPIPVFGRWLS